MLENTYNAKRGGRQFNMFISQNICTLVDLFGKKVVEGRVVTVETRLEGDDET